MMNANIIHRIAETQRRTKPEHKHVDQIRLEQLVMWLRTERCKLQHELARGSHIIPESCSFFLGDNIPDMAIPDLENQERHKILHQMAQIDAAIKQIEAGSYNHCEGCGKRLIHRAPGTIPAVYCRHCRSEIE